MASITKFSFDTNFDSLESSNPRVVEQEAPPPAPTFSEADLVAARQSGFTEGHAAGAAEMQLSTESDVAQALGTISNQLGALGPTVTQTLQHSQHEAIEIARSITRKMLASQTVESILPSIEAVITKILPRIMDEPRVVIRVSDGILDALQAQLPSVTERCGFPGSLILLAEPELNGPDCRIEWADGGAEHNSESLWSEIDGLIERYLAGIGIEDATAGKDAAALDAVPDEQTNFEEQTNG